MNIIQDIKLDFKDVLIRPAPSTLNSRSEVNLERTFHFKHTSKTWTGIPIIAANMDTVGTLSMAKSLQKYKMLTALHKFIPVKDIAQQISLGHINPNYVAFTTGIRDLDWARLAEFRSMISGSTWSGVNLSKEIDIIMIDVPNGYIPKFIDSCKRIREMFPEHIIMAGNVATGEGAARILCEGHVDIVKIGIGPGALCRTRNKTGVSFPQLSAIDECSKAAHVAGGMIIGDGGCKDVSDIAKGFSAGAEFIMLGAMLAGHDESEGELVDRGFDIPKAVKVYGMSSTHAMQKYYGKQDSYRASEGALMHVEYKGAVDNTVQDILGGLRSTCTYIGAKNIEEMPKKATFIRIT